MSSFTTDPADATCIATIRTLAADVVGKANSGHPGEHVLILRALHAPISMSVHQVHPWVWLL
jgi:transketolase